MPSMADRSRQEILEYLHSLAHHINNGGEFQCIYDDLRERDAIDPMATVFALEVGQSWLRLHHDLRVRREQIRQGRAGGSRGPRRR